MWVPQIQKYGQKWEISPKSQKNEKYSFFSKFYRQIFRIPRKVPSVWFSWSYLSYLSNYEIFKWKKKFFFSKSEKKVKKNNFFLSFVFNDKTYEEINYNEYSIQRFDLKINS